ATIGGQLEKALDGVRVKELERGVSLVGPQRDDVVVSLTGPSAGEAMDARSFASQGDQRTAALALKLGERDLLAAILKEPPVMLLDDVFSELDPKRRAWLSEAVRSEGQTFVSSAQERQDDVAEADLVVEIAAGHLRTR